MKICGAFGTVLMVGLIGAPAAVHAQAEEDQVIIVPYSQKNLALPHPTHEEAQITLKGIIRNATCATYRVTWDVNRNGDFEDDWHRDVSREGTSLTVRDIGRTLKIPRVNNSQSYNINVRTRNTCNGQDKFGTMRLFIYNFRPDNNPVNWTPEQIEIMASMAVQESLWYAHRQTTGISGRDTSTITAHSPYFAATNVTLWQFTVNGHLPAYPPGSIDHHDVSLPVGWEAENDRRWNVDPYAETVMRMVNRLTQDHSRVVIPAADESNEHGYQWDGNAYVAQTHNRLPDTTDGGGSWAWGGNNTYKAGMNLGALATALPALAGTPMQNGPSGWLWERYVQELTDTMGYMQIDGACAKGGWYYTAFNGDGACQHGDFSTTQWAFVGLESASAVGEPYGVFVNNRHKYRSAYQILSNQQTDGGAAYDNRVGGGGRGSDFKMTGGAILALRMVGVHNMPADARIPFPNEAGTIPTNFADRNAGYARGAPMNRAALVHAYGRLLGYSAAWFDQRKVFGSHWLDGNWQHGDYLCDNTNAIYNAGRCGNTYSIYSNQKGFATGLPELTHVGVHDWRRQYNTYYVRAMDRAMSEADPISGYNLFGRLIDDYCETTSTTCNYGSGHLGSAMGGLVLTPTVFNPKPVAIAEAVPEQVVEGCAGGNAGEVTFSHGGSFHPDAGARIVGYQWDVDAADGLWWEVAGADVDFETDTEDEVFEYRYLEQGTYTATLRAIDSGGQSKTTAVTVEVIAALNVQPAAGHGGPYAVEVGQNLQLDGNVTDQNLGCGDVLTVSWDLDDDGVFDDANGASPNLAWAALAGLNEGAGNANLIRIKAVDRDGAEVVEETTLTIFAREPVASGLANPNPAACQQEVTFNGSGSAHDNPARSITQWDWDIDGDGNFDGSGQVFRFSYGAFGTYDVTLRVTDDLGRAGQETFEVAVSLGNQAPVARVAEDALVVLEGDALTLDGRGSSDPDVACGDSIAQYAWDLDGNGRYDDAVDLRGANPVVAWPVLAATLNWPADPGSGLPRNTITLRVTDEFGVTGTATVEVRIYEANPVAQVVQSPNPAPINLITGNSVATLDGRQSFSAVPSVTIAEYQWDLDDDGVFEVRGPAIVNAPHIFDPVPVPPAPIPDVFVGLRVIDSNGRTDDQRYAIIYDVPPTIPTADADPSDPPERGYDLLVGEALILDGSQSFDPDAADFGDVLVAYRWDLDYDAELGFEADAEIVTPGQAAEPRIVIPWAALEAAGLGAPGSYPIRLQVQDSTDLTNVDDTVVRVHAFDPVARAEVVPNPAGCGVAVTFDGSASSHGHPEIDVVGYAWDFDGDGEDDAEGAQVQHTYEAFTFDGPRQVRLTVEDDREHAHAVIVEVPVTAGNRAPSGSAGGHRDGNAEVVGPYAVAVGEPLRLDATGSVDPDDACDDRIVGYQWDLLNNGSFDGNGKQLELSWLALNAAGINGPGRYEVRLRVTDRLGATGDALTTLVVAGPPQAVAVASPNRAGCQQLVEFSGDGSTFSGPAEQGYAIVAYAWDLDGDGDYDDADGVSVARPVVALPDENGIIRVVASLQVTDAAGRTGTDDVVVLIDVQNGAPVANAGGPYNTGPIAGGFSDVTLDGRASLDPNAPCDRVAVYKWDTDNDGLYGDDDNPDDLMGATAAYNNENWQINTAQTVRLVVCDEAGACSQPGETSIEVQAHAPLVAVLISPRADADRCYAAGQLDVELTVADIAGEVVTATVLIGGVELGQRAVDTPDDGTPVGIVIPVNTALVPEGRHEVIVSLRSAGGAVAQASSGGRITFDRTAPVVEIGNELADGVCYNPHALPAPTITATDALDNVPTVSRSVQLDGCGRVLQVSATDACGNVGRAARSYLTADSARAIVQGTDEGELVDQASLTWTVEGPGACASNISAQYSREGAAQGNYAEGQVLNEAGAYAVTVTVANCLGIAREQIRSFSVNAPPVAVVIPAGHPFADPNRANAYVVREGADLELDATASLTPEPTDELVGFEWDLDNNGVYEAHGETVRFNTRDNGVFDGSLKVTDSLGANHVSPFRVTVTDVLPTADAGGPYVVTQGTPLRVDGRGSVAGSHDDDIGNYIWHWGDGTPDDAGAGLSRTLHTYNRNGVFTIRLTVQDEDSADVVETQVTVRDVDPIIEGINAPEGLYEIAPMPFSVDVAEGADPATRYEWDFDGDGVADYAGDGLSEVSHQFETAGRYNVTVTVRDGDSASVDAVLVDVREATLAEIIAWVDEKVAIDQLGGLPLLAEFQLGGIATDLDQARWGEEYNQRGSTLMALEVVVRKLVAAQAQGADFHLELFALTRQLLREVSRLADRRRDEDGVGNNTPSMLAARRHIEASERIINDPAYRVDLAGNNNLLVASELVFETSEAYYWLQDTVDQCNAYGDFAIPPGVDTRDPIAMGAAGTDINTNDVRPALLAMRQELVSYRDLGNALDPAPGTDRVNDVVAQLDLILEMQGFALGPICPRNQRCITDREALDLELMAASLVRELDVAGSQGAWVRQWQSCMVLALKFRIELSIVRVEFACGRNAMGRYARDVQSVGLDFVRELEDSEALTYYSDDETMCAMVQVYDECLVPAFPIENQPYDGPVRCFDDEDGDANACDNLRVLVDGQRQGTTGGDTTLTGACGGDGPEVGFAYTPEDDGVFCASTDGSGFDTVLYVYRDVCGDPDNELDCNDDSDRLQDLVSELTIDGEAGRDYFLMVDGLDEGDRGDYTITVRAGACADAEGFACEAPVALTVGQPIEGETRGNSTLDSYCGGGESPEVVHRFVIEGEGEEEGGNAYCLTTAGSEFDTVLHVYDGDCGEQEALVGCNDDNERLEELTSELTINVNPGQPYFVAVDGANEDERGDYTLALWPGRCDAARACLDAEPLELGAFVEGKLDEGESTIAGYCGGGETPERVFSYTPEVDGAFCLSTVGSDFDTILTLYRDVCGAARNEVACNDENLRLDTDRAELTVNSEAGSTWFIVLDGDEDVGDFLLSVMPGTCADPEPLACEEAAALSLGRAHEGVTQGRSTITSYCGGETGAEAVHVFTPEQDGMYCANTQGSDFDTVLAIFGGDCGAGDSELECNDDIDEDVTSAVSFVAEAGVDYFVVVDGYDEEESGDYTVVINEGPCDMPQACMEPLQVELLEVTEGETEGDSSMEGYCGGGDSPEVVHLFIPEDDGAFCVTTQGSDFDTVLSIYEGTCGSGDAELDCNDNNDELEELAAELTFEGQAGEIYYLVVDGFGEEQGDYRLLVLPGACDGDNGAVLACAEPDSIDLGESVEGVTEGESALESYCGGDEAPEVVHVYVPEEDGEFCVTTRGSDFDTMLSVFTECGDPGTEIDCNDDTDMDRYDDLTSDITVEGEAGQPYYVVVDGYDEDESGDYRLSVLPGACEDALMCDLPEAELEFGEAVYGDTDDEGSYSFGGECGGEDSPELIYTFVPEEDAAFCVSTFNVDFDTILSVHAGVCGGENEIQCNDAEDSDPTNVTVDGEAGLTYFIVVDGDDDDGEFELSVLPGSCEDLAEGICDEAQPIDVGEPVQGETEGRGFLRGYCGGEEAPEDVFVFRPEAGGEYCVSTADSDFDTILTVYGDGCVADNEVDCNDDSDFEDDLTSAVTLEVDGETSYFIVVDGYDNEEHGDYQLSITEGPCGGAQACEDICDFMMICELEGMGEGCVPGCEEGLPPQQRECALDADGCQDLERCLAGDLCEEICMIAGECEVEALNGEDCVGQCQEGVPFEAQVCATQADGCRDFNACFGDGDVEGECVLACAFIVGCEGEGDGGMEECVGGCIEGSTPDERACLAEIGECELIGLCFGLEGPGPVLEGPN